MKKSEAPNAEWPEFKMSRADATVYKYSKLLAEHTAPQIEQRYKKLFAWFKNEKPIAHVIEPVYFVIFDTVAPLIRYIESPKRHCQVRADALIRKGVIGGLISSKVYKVMHHAGSSFDSYTAWSDLPSDVRKMLRDLYREQESLAYYALMHWTGGFVNKRVGAWLNKL